VVAVGEGLGGVPGNGVRGVKSVPKVGPGGASDACIAGMTAVARVPKALDRVDENMIYKTLDRGAPRMLCRVCMQGRQGGDERQCRVCAGMQGIIVPHVNTKAEAETVVAACKFKNEEFPMGRRGMFVSRQGFGVADYFMQANHETLCVVLIEDIVAVNNLAEILTVEHIDVFHVAFAGALMRGGRTIGWSHTRYLKTGRKFTSPGGSFVLGW
jgi:hypothetical protein